jgi:hypothetical protein
LACIAALFTLPIALLAGRYLRQDYRWCKIHIIFNSITILLIIIVFGLGMGAVSTAHLGTQFNGPYSDFHHKLGMAVFVVVLLQGILGFFAHRTKMGTAARRIHLFFGACAAGLVYWETWEGMHREWNEMSTPLLPTPTVVQVLFWALLLIPAVAYAVALGQTVLNSIADQESDVLVDSGISSSDQNESSEKTNPTVQE